MVASETCALDTVGAEFIRDLEPGEIITITEDGVKSNRQYCNMVKPARCIFEYIYFARPDSVIDDVSVFASRIMAGRILAQSHPVEADMVVGVPESGNAAAWAILWSLAFRMGRLLLRILMSAYIHQAETEYA